MKKAMREVKCPKCNGEGVISKGDKDWNLLPNCSKCKGKGYVKIKELQP
jgi:DnaJ-class molecular chaperone